MSLEIDESVATIRLRDGRVYAAHSCDIEGAAVLAVARRRTGTGPTTDRQFIYASPAQYLWPLHQVAEVVWTVSV